MFCAYNFSVGKHLIDTHRYVADGNTIMETRVERLKTCRDGMVQHPTTKRSNVLDFPTWVSRYKKIRCLSSLTMRNYVLESCYLTSGEVSNTQCGDWPAATLHGQLSQL